jgi:hypothetical protein
VDEGAQLRSRTPYPHSFFNCLVLLIQADDRAALRDFYAALRLHTEADSAVNHPSDKAVEDDKNTANRPQNATCKMVVDWITEREALRKSKKWEAAGG